jgi:hypothetical protein
MTLADLTDGARKVVFCINPEQDPPVLVEGESDMTKVMGHFTRGTTSGPVFFCVDDLDCSASAAVEKAPEFATALDRIWVSQSVLSPIRYIGATEKETT